MPSAQLLAQQALQTGDYGRAIRLLTDAMGSASPATTPFLVTQWLLARQRLLRQQSSLERPTVMLLTQASTVSPAVFSRARQALAGWCELRVTDVATLDRAGAWWTTVSQARVDALLLLVDHPEAWRCALTARWLWGACVWHATGSEPQSPLVIERIPTGQPRSRRRSSVPPTSISASSGWDIAARTRGLFTELFIGNHLKGLIMQSRAGRLKPRRSQYAIQF